MLLRTDPDHRCSQATRVVRAQLSRVWVVAVQRRIGVAHFPDRWALVGCCLIVSNYRAFSPFFRGGGCFNSLSKA
ncbi:hypothetical protein IF1G_03416 [Cordyceps javanica]|uniref:Uncharacterized protein n=1 Tax=Cordyceps javanica TaxID=43265 RepID=A0A545V7I8_9HYPO|nr:hypothetical protein IF1G_03416 [Cordyceps javanica]